MQVRVEESTSDYVFAHWDRIVLAVWRGRTTVAAVRKGDHLMHEHAARCGAPIRLLTIIEEAAPLPPVEARMELVACLKRGAGTIERSALVFEGEGFRAASVRAVVAGVSLFSRPAYPHRVFNSVANAARFLANDGGPQPASHALIRAVRDARRRTGVSTFVPWLPGSPEPAISMRHR